MRDRDKDFLLSKPGDKLLQALADNLGVLSQVGSPEDAMQRHVFDKGNIRCYLRV